MARKEIIITLEDRDNPLTFRIRQMPATKLETWLIRALLLLAGSGIEVPVGADMQKAGAVLAQGGLSMLGAVNFDKAKPLLDDLLGCCHRVLPEGGEMQVTESTVDGYIEDVRTLFRLRTEALKLNLDFFGSGVLATFRHGPETGKSTPSMPTSPR